METGKKSLDWEASGFTPIEWTGFFDWIFIQCLRINGSESVF